MKKLKKITESKLLEKLNSLQEPRDIPKRYILTEEMIEKYADDYGLWYNVSKHQSMTDDFLNKHKDKIFWGVYFSCQPIDIDRFLKHNENNRYWNSDWFWYNVSINQNMTEEIAEKYEYMLNWYNIGRNVNVTESFIEKFEHKLDWYCISRYQKISTDFILKHQEKIRWNGLFQNKFLEKDFFEKNKHLIKVKIKSYDLSLMVKFQKLSQETITEIKKGKMVWDSLSAYADIPRDLVIENYEKINKRSLRWNMKINEEVKKEVEMIEKLSGHY